MVTNNVSASEALSVLFDDKLPAFIQKKIEEIPNTSWMVTNKAYRDRGKSGLLERLRKRQKPPQ